MPLLHHSRHNLANSVKSQVSREYYLEIQLKMRNIIGKTDFSEMTQIVGKTDHLCFKFKYNFCNMNI